MIDGRLKVAVQISTLTPARGIRKWWIVAEGRHKSIWQVSKMCCVRRSTSRIPIGAVSCWNEKEIILLTLLTSEHLVLTRRKMLHGMRVGMANRNRRTTSGHHAHHRSALSDLRYTWSSHPRVDLLCHRNSRLPAARHALVRLRMRHGLTSWWHASHCRIETLGHRCHHDSLEIKGARAAQPSM